MDTKKLIGAIVGVIAFIALVAGATFAWLSVNASVVNRIFNNATSKNFTFTYTGSPIVRVTKQLTLANFTKANVTSATVAATAGDGWAAVTASKSANMPKAGVFRLKLRLSSNTLTTNSALWAVCKGDCPTTALITAVSGTTATCGTGTNIVACGVVPAGSTTAIILYSDTSTFNVDAAASATYNFYAWLNSETIANADLGKGISGDIIAEASQNASGMSEAGFN